MVQKLEISAFTELKQKIQSFSTKTVLKVSNNFLVGNCDAERIVSIAGNATGHFAVGLFAVRHFAVGHFAVRLFCRWTFRRIFCRVDIS